MSRTRATRSKRADRTRAVSVRVTGVVQGVGFRPFVHALATRHGLSGHVGNDADGVFIEAAGPAPAVDAFLTGLRDEAPPLAVVDRVMVTERQSSLASRGRGLQGSAEGGFVVVPSPTAGSATAATSIPPDTAVCDACLTELRDPADRRFGYPFIACTHCGPRFTMVTGLPYDRDRTTMVDFPLCAACQAEYEDPRSRRFHAEPTACPDCGPALSMPVPAVVAALRSGRIVAIKGVGGYHLACDAGNDDAVNRLRTRKQRGDKPFAVMVADLGEARRIADLDDRAADLLVSPARPIVLARGRDEALRARVAPGTNLIGVLLPYAPLHHLMFDAGAPRALVMTSGNLSDEPICIDVDEAEERLAGIADVFCHHDRRIHVSCDDSVVRIVAGQPQPVRRSRGYAPLPVRLPMSSPPAIAVGGELKATAAVAAGSRAWLSQHIGDTSSPATLDMLARSIDTLVALQRVRPGVVVSDAHPGYLSHGWAARKAESIGAEHLVVQHHHAHLASLLAEHGMAPDEPVLGVVFDGTGFGADGTIWGGELLLGSYAAAERVGHLRPILLPGGDAAIRYPPRTAVSHLLAAGIDPLGTASAEALRPGQLELLTKLLTTGSHCVPTSSVGRLFDAVASLLDVCQVADFEAQAATALEAVATAGVGTPVEPTRLGGEAFVDATTPAGQPLVLDPRPWIARAVADHATGVPAPIAARRFHTALAESVVATAERIRRDRGVATVGLTGGVFANALMTSDCRHGLESRGFTVLTHRVVPPNDGGLALGQVAVAAAGGAARPGAFRTASSGVR